MRRHLVAVVACTLLAIPGAFLWSEKVLNNFEIQEPSKHDMRLAARAVRDIDEILDVIGHGVAIRTVDAGWFEERWAAAYGHDRTITIDARFVFTDDYLLFVMAHECVHALFRQHHLLQESPPILKYQGLVHETAASVLGAYVAGAVRTRRGGNGPELTGRLLKDYRMVCDNFQTQDFVDRVVALTDSTSVELGEKKILFWPGGYFGTKTLIDSVDTICREHPDPYDAAFAIATSLHNIDEATASKIAIPVDWRPRR